MLDNSILEQLKSVFSKLEGKIVLEYNKCAHAKQPELQTMLHQVAQTSEYIEIREKEEYSETPRLSLLHNGTQTGVRFHGVPAGHEFSSLVLAILNADGKGKLPDAGIIAKIRRIRGPVRLRTFVSLSCENCPDVVQALNLMALLHSDFQHEMVDGGFVPDEVQALNIQGVPSVMAGSELLSSGKADFAELLSKLEAHFGVQEMESKEKVDRGRFDVVVIGAGPAGASAAIYSARKGLKTAIVAEKMGGQVQDTKGIENLISLTYTEGPKLAAQLAEHIAAYDISLLEHRRVTKISGESVKELELSTGEILRGESLIVATGAKWRELGVPGEKEFLGRGVAFCPHCDGPYYKGKDIAVIGGGNSGVEAAIDLAGIVKSVTLLEFGEEFRADSVLLNKLRSLPNVSLRTQAQTTSIVGNGEKVTGLVYTDRGSGQEKKLELDGVFVQIGLRPNSEFIKGAVSTNPYGEIIIDEKGRTNVKGIYAAGDVTTVPYKQIVISIGEGAKAALAAFEDRMVQ